MNQDLFDEIMQGTAEAKAYLDGNRDGYKVHVPDSIDVRSIRASLKLSQVRFADTFGLSVDSVRHWESGRRLPEAPARILLAVIARNPGAVIEALTQPAPLKLASSSTKAGQIGRSGRPRKFLG